MHLLEMLYLPHIVPDKPDLSVPVVNLIGKDLPLSIIDAYEVLFIRPSSAPPFICIQHIDNPWDGNTIIAVILTQVYRMENGKRMRTVSIPSTVEMYDMASSTQRNNIIDLWADAEYVHADSVETLKMMLEGLTYKDMCNIICVTSVGICVDMMSRAAACIHLGEVYYTPVRIANNIEHVEDVLSMVVMKYLSLTFYAPEHVQKYFRPMMKWIETSVMVGLVLDMTPVHISIWRMRDSFRASEDLKVEERYSGQLLTLSNALKSIRVSLTESDMRDVKGRSMCRGEVMRDVKVSWNPFGTVTGRITSSSPNVQGLPSTMATRLFHTEDKNSTAFSLHYGPRSWISAPHGYILVSADYRAMELCVIAQETGDEALIRVVESTDDPFLHIGNIMKTDMERSDIKTLVYGTLYGMGLARVAGSMGVTLSVAKTRLDAFRRSFPKLALYTARLNGQYSKLKNGQSDFVIVPLSSRPRKVTKAQRPKKPAASTHAVFSTIIQGIAAFITNEAARRTLRMGKLVMVVHDELIFEVMKSTLSESLGDIKLAMETLPHPQAKSLRVRIKVGSNLGEMVEYK